MKAQIIERDGAPEYAVIPYGDYLKLVEHLEDEMDLALVREFKADLAAGREELIPSAVVDQLLDGVNSIKVWRNHRGLTQEQLAVAAGVTKQFIWQLENGASKCSVDTLVKLAGALRVDLDDLVD
ncbi:MAG: hypothetical protein A2286_04865 [Gammaproteobacteria bacterium RIFOXYA12_FULL_61_12]|nr:MAG: hypothetical protein A2514_13595 [Gammaproteobacteria bacterium RIFOXYD12_FULL_61_37]OGT93787.1 MAG: hypothetical protein A2286_04865 [Gammaproteobacteria bacterium RIFOXYA12_FULL_61_12]